jgi:hypothetical protein
MVHILYLHGNSPGPFDSKTEYLQRRGHEVVGRPRLPYPRHPRRSWRWLVAYFNQGWFHDAIAAAQQACEACGPDVVVGSSMGGAVAMNIGSGYTSQVLLAPAWRAGCLLRFGQAVGVKAATVVIHGDRDRTISPRYSRRLLGDSRLRGGEAGLVASVECGLRERLSGQGPYRVVGRPVLVRGEGHRCNGEAALRALLAGVEVLSGLPPCRQQAVPATSR